MESKKDIISKIYDFYEKRYSEDVVNMKKKFHIAIKDLIETGDITYKNYVSFCTENNIEPDTKLKPKPVNTDPCGHSSGYRSSC